MNKSPFKSMMPYKGPDKIGYLRLPVLQFLWGHPLDQVAANFIHSLNPSMIRVIPEDGAEHTDAWLGRVSIYVISGVIKDIYQEVEVGLDGGYIHAHHLHCQALNQGIKLP